ncbi:ATP-binding protein [Thalassotalea sp. Y01]|uniref:ATP-binding protein n=1 Tax=Thalassotalea sp. Y01 TaxID=2729613 RepID=UPI00145EDFC2|nr:ATP-binding protein [Thalassotalea sp. Y01]NMP17475.1 ATP-binding protein [Thalassotalea sp. Y01]
MSSKHNQQQITLLIGPPGCGKSTFAKKLHGFHISSDTIVERLCRQHRINYRQFFELATSHPIRIRHQRLFQKRIAQSKHHDLVVWDLTNLTRSDRQRAIGYYPGAQYIAICFKNSDNPAYLREVNHKRQQSEQKFIPDTVLDDMLKRYQAPTKAEGFSDIISV